MLENNTGYDLFRPLQPPTQAHTHTVLNPDPENQTPNPKPGPKILSPEAQNQPSKKPLL